jgi:hypothetical protein
MTTVGCGEPTLVVSPVMIIDFEPFREWVYKTRRRKGSIKPEIYPYIKGARSLHGRHADASGEIMPTLEPDTLSSIGSLDPSKLPGFNIKQLTEPMLRQKSSSLQERYKP